ncbi:hypothetical protein D9598_19640 [Roseomonas sp. KE0001]|nr:hypothetical protein [Roseomonas sp. KE0001]
MGSGTVNDANGWWQVEGDNLVQNFYLRPDIIRFTDGVVVQNDGNGLVNDLLYYSKNKDVWQAGMDAEEHYLRFGWAEGRDTGSLFDAEFYLRQNQDVKAAGVNPLQHYLEFGASEGRDPTALFDTSFYVAENPDVAASGMNALSHYELFGRFEHRNPNEWFDAAFYGEQLLYDLVDPYRSYLKSTSDYGVDIKSPSAKFDAEAYLEASPDVAYARLNPLAHYLEFGQHEGRQAYPVDLI